MDQGLDQANKASNGMRLASGQGHYLVDKSRELVDKSLERACVMYALLGSLMFSSAAHAADNPIINLLKFFIKEMGEIAVPAITLICIALGFAMWLNKMSSKYMFIFPIGAIFVFGSSWVSNQLQQAAGG